MTLLCQTELCLLSLFCLLPELGDRVSDFLYLQFVLLCSLLQLLNLYFILASINLFDEVVESLNFFSRLGNQGCLSSALLSSGEVEREDTILIFA